MAKLVVFLFPLLIHSSVTKYKKPHLISILWILPGKISYGNVASFATNPFPYQNQGDNTCNNSKWVIFQEFVHLCCHRLSKVTAVTPDPRLTQIKLRGNTEIIYFQKDFFSFFSIFATCSFNSVKYPGECIWFHEVAAVNKIIL